MATRMDKMQAGFFSVLGSEFNPDPNNPVMTVQWSYQQPSYEQLQSNVINLQLFAGPTMVYQNRARGTTLLPPTLITLTIPTATVGQLYYVKINDFYYKYEAVGGDTVDTIRDNLVGAINSDDYDPFTASATLNPGEFDIVPDTFGSIYQVAISDNITATDVQLSDTPVLVTNGTRQATIQIQTFSKSSNPRDGAWAIMDKIQDITLTQELVDRLWDVYGIRIINFGVVSDISAIAGASWESRCSSDMTINLDSVSTRATDAIDGLNFTLNTKAPGGMVSWEDTINF